MVMLISIFIPQTFTEFQNGDPGRIAAQVVSGIGFLGAGAGVAVERGCFCPGQACARIRRRGHAGHDPDPAVFTAAGL